ncbi:amidohydrolase family protein [Caproiciproducens galactitolivorans]|uniref:Amidohydrolase family protein n=1 Tax=Caproiciproducens galactitolivorans TaxID=642589 RepID=A0ABT4BUU2_9FIRM|nr:amidohydrolase family protein [Caproiciproducens galactitolivorans]MCY1713683.1 amidohydrolase family protein [Caproiciproducens galactitolivorans]
MLIDMHIHPIFYDIICENEKELGFRKDTFGVWKQGPMRFDELFAEMEAGSVDKAALLPLDLTTTAGGWVVNNDQIAKIVSVHPERFIGFASVDPHREDALEVLDYAFGTLKLEGLKLHPAKQKFYPTDAFMEPIYQKCIEYNKPILFHAGLSWEPNTPTKYCHPVAFEEVAINHPDLRICLAHFAWPWVREMVMLMIKYPNIYTDTSVLYLDSPEESIARVFTVDMGPLWFERSFYKQVLFASNGPRFRAFKIKRALDKIPMRDYAREALYSGNAIRFLKGEA